MSNALAPARRTKRPTAAVAKQEAQIIWALSMGDINENHAGGNASKVLNSRLRDLGVKVDSKSAYNRLSQLVTRGAVEKLSEGGKTYALRLQVNPEEFGPNPFEAKMARLQPSIGGDEPKAKAESSTPVVIDLTTGGATIAELLAGPMTQRINAAKLLMASVGDELFAQKANI